MDGANRCTIRLEPGSLLLVVLLHVLAMAAGVYVLLAFRSLLLELEDFRTTDRLIPLLIWIDVASAGLGLVGLLPQSLGLSSVWTVASVVLAGGLLVGHGIVSIVFGRKLLSMKDDLCGLLRPFAYTTVARGILTLTVVGAPIGLALALAASVMASRLRAQSRSQAIRDAGEIGVPLAVVELALRSREEDRVRSEGVGARNRRFSAREAAGPRRPRRGGRPHASPWAEVCRPAPHIESACRSAAILAAL